MNLVSIGRTAGRCRRGCGRSAGVDRVPRSPCAAYRVVGQGHDRIHILEGREPVLLNIDEVIAIIRRTDEPKAALIARFRLSDRQAEDILEIRLRQLARLEAIKIQQELEELREEKGKLEEILDSPAALKRLMIKEIEQDAKQFGDERRTLIEAEKRAVAEQKVIDEPVTVIVSEKGWVRARPATATTRRIHVQGRRLSVRGLRMPHGRYPAGLRQQRQVTRCRWRRCRARAATANRSPP